MTPLRQRMTDAMLQRGFSPRTRESYVDAIYGMAKHYRRDPVEYTAAEVEAYLLHMVKEHHLSYSTMNQAACAARFLYEKVLGHERRLFSIPALHAQQGGEQAPSPLRNGQSTRQATRIAVARRNRPTLQRLPAPCPSHAPANYVRDRPAGF